MPKDKVEKEVKEVKDKLSKWSKVCKENVVKEEKKIARLQKEVEKETKDKVKKEVKEVKELKDKSKPKVNTFTIRYEKDSKDLVEVYIDTHNYHDYHEWMPYVWWDRQYKETSPMTVSLNCPIVKIEQLKKILTNHGYKEEKGKTKNGADKNDAAVNDMINHMLKKLGTVDSLLTLYTSEDYKKEFKDVIKVSEISETIDKMVKELNTLCGTNE